jgi:hypothetical protein
MLQFFCGLFIGHNLKVIDKKFIPPTHRLTRCNGEMSQEGAMLLVGYTTISTRCERCGEINFEKFIGQY